MAVLCLCVGCGLGSKSFVFERACSGNLPVSGTCPDSAGWRRSLQESWGVVLPRGGGMVGVGDSEMSLSLGNALSMEFAVSGSLEGPAVASSWQGLKTSISSADLLPLDRGPVTGGGSSRKTDTSKLGEFLHRTNTRGVRPLPTTVCAAVESLGAVLWDTLEYLG